MVLAVGVEGPVVVEVSALQEGPELEDRLGSLQAPSRACDVGRICRTAPPQGSLDSRSHEDGAVVDPASRVRFPVELTSDGGMLTLDNQSGFGIDFNDFTLPFSRFRVAGMFAPDGDGRQAFGVFAQAICGDIDFYGGFFRQLGFCNPDSDILAAVGAVELDLCETAKVPPGGVGTVAWQLVPGAEVSPVKATFTGSTLVAAAHNLGVLVVAPDGRPLASDYVEGPSVTSDAGHPTSVSVGCPADAVVGQAWLMLETSAVAHYAW